MMDVYLGIKVVFIKLGHTIYTTYDNELIGQYNNVLYKYQRKMMRVNRYINIYFHISTSYDCLYTIGNNKCMDIIYKDLLVHNIKCEQKTEYDDLKTPFDYLNYFIDYKNVRELIPLRDYYIKIKNYNIVISDLKDRLCYNHDETGIVQNRVAGLMISFESYKLEKIQLYTKITINFINLL